MLVKALPFLAAFLMWAAFKPLGAGPLVFFSAFFYLILVAWPQALPEKSYKRLYYGSAIAWLCILHGIRLAFWPLYLGWAALSLYVAIYIPLFVVVSRYLIFRWRWPLALAAPLVWTGCELLRCYVMTGFGGCLLSHAMAEHPIAIQMTAHIGPHLLSGLYVFIAATVLDLCRLSPSLRARLWPTIDRTNPFSVKLDRTPPMIPDATDVEMLPHDIPLYRPVSKLALALQVSVIVMTGVFSYLQYQHGQMIEASAKSLLKVALIQENAETRFEINPDRADESTKRYLALTHRTGLQHPDLDLVVWPESIFSLRSAFFDWDGKTMPDVYAEYVGLQRDPYASAREYQRMNIENVLGLQRIAGGASLQFGQPDPALPNKPALLVGASRHKVREGSGFAPYNSALFQPKSGPIEFYDKRYLVMFGEYIPFASNIPIIYDSLGMAVLGIGDHWSIFDVDGVKIAPSICFEDMLPQAMQSQTATLIRAGTPPDVLVNVTNDGWFHGSSMLDHHLACAIFSAVENRRPMLVAANTGISTWITGNGTVKARSGRETAEVIIAEPTADGRWGLWQTVGDWPARLCAAVVVLALLIMGWKSQIKAYHDRRNETTANAQPA